MSSNASVAPGVSAGQVTLTCWSPRQRLSPHPFLSMGMLAK